MQQLSGLDATFIYTEQPHAPTHITSIAIYDQSTAPGGKVTFKGILSHLSDRLHLARAFRQKVVRLPNDIDHPYWIEDQNFDLEYHVRHIALPKPGDWRQFCIQVARLHARPLDLSKPLWEMYVIEGLDAIDGIPEGAFAIVLKVHHAAVDGKSGVEMVTAMNTQSVDEAPPPPPEVPWKGEPEPNQMELLARAGLNAWRLPMRGFELATRMMPGMGRAAALQRKQGDAALTGSAPATKFNVPVSPHRVIDARFFDFALLKGIRALVPGATVNDVALTVIGGALRKYLSATGDLPDASLRAMTPISVRDESQRKDLGNLVSAMNVSLCTDIEDPVKRLAAVHESTSASKEMTEAIGARNLTDMSQFAPGALLGLGARLAGDTVRRGFNGAMNMVVTNVPGPRMPLYLAGAEMVRNFGAGPVVDGAALINIVGSYQNDFILCFTADREAMPDPERYAGALQESFDELVAASKQ